MERVVVISVHPDDETLGCGGTILKHMDSGDEVSCIFVTSGNNEQNKIAADIIKKYNFKNAFYLNLPENELRDISIDKLISPIANAFKELKPQIIYIPNRSDIHSDHRAVFEAVMTCTKSFRYPFVEKVLMCEVISETDFAPSLSECAFLPNYYVDISKTFKRKIEILNLFKSELLPYPETRNIETMTALNRLRGSQISCEYAESFMAVKIIVK
jgi:LmbE family N-acetylglucosaminyl deacetylase